MTRVVATLLLAVALAGCSSKSDDKPAAQSAAPTSATVAASPARTKACQQFSAFFASLREQAKTSNSGWTPEQGVTQLLATLEESPAWASSSEADKQAAIAGVKDAANGVNCG